MWVHESVLLTVLYQNGELHLFDNTGALAQKTVICKYSIII